jgi:hypothetical protein
MQFDYGRLQSMTNRSLLVCVATVPDEERIKNG